MSQAGRVGLLLSAIVTLVFFAMVLAMAFWPEAMAGSRGLIASLAFIVLCLLAMGGYSWWRLARLE
jgi:hypothetical protein